MRRTSRSEDAEGSDEEHSKRKASLILHSWEKHRYGTALQWWDGPAGNSFGQWDACGPKLRFVRISLHYKQNQFVQLNHFNKQFIRKRSQISRLRKTVILKARIKRVHLNAHMKSGSQIHYKMLQLPRCKMLFVLFSSKKWINYKALSEQNKQNKKMTCNAELNICFEFFFF